MGQIIYGEQKPRFCNIAAIQTGGNKANTILAKGEIWLVDTTNTTKPNGGAGIYDAYIVGDNSKVASALTINYLTARVDLSAYSTTEQMNTAIQNAVSGKQDSITAVNVNVDDSTGTPSGSASFNSGTLTLNLSNLKGATGAAGETGATGAKGDKGDKGEDGRITEINHGTNDTTFTLTPNVRHVWGEVTALNLTLAAGDSGYSNEYLFRFFSGSTPTVLTLPQTIQWVQPLTCQQDKYYEVSIVNNLAAYITSGMVAAESRGGTPEYATKDWVTNKIATEIDGGFYYV